MPSCRVLLALLFLSACYNPQILNRGYRCNPDDTPACPVGFQCIDGYCDDGSGRSVAPDLASPADLAPPPPDLARSCVGSGGDCRYHRDSVCCSKYCVYRTNTCQ
jgi:hypothetical protein